MLKKIYQKIGFAVMILATLTVLLVGVVGALSTASAAEVTSYTITVNIAEDAAYGKVYLQIGSGTPQEVVSGKTYTLAQGTMYELTADPNTGYYDYWINADTGVPSVMLKGSIGSNKNYSVSFLPEEYTIHYVDQHLYEFRNGLVTSHVYNSETVIKNPSRDGYKLVGWMLYNEDPTAAEAPITGKQVAPDFSLGKNDYTADVWLQPIWEGLGYCVIRFDCVFVPGAISNRGECLNVVILTDYKMGDTVLGSYGVASEYKGYNYYEAYDYAANAIQVKLSFLVENAGDIDLEKVKDNPGLDGYNVVFRYYIPKEYTITPVLNAGDDVITWEDGKTMPEKHVFNANTSIPTPVRVGYTFNYWTVTVDGVEQGKVYPGGVLEAKKYDGNITLSAVWTANQYDVIYDWNGKDDADDAKIAEQNKTLTKDYGKYTYDSPVAFPYPVRTGYSFDGWIITVGGEQYGESAVKDLPAELFSMADPKAITLTAQWKANSYKVTLDGNQATTPGTPEYLTATFDSPFSTEGLIIPRRFGYTFLGYYLHNSDGTKTLYIKADGTTDRIWDVASDCTLVAEWEKLPTVAAPNFSVNYKDEIITVEGGIPNGHYEFWVGETKLDVVVTDGKITVNKVTVSKIVIPEEFFGEDVQVLVWGDGVTTSNNEFVLPVVARPAAPKLNQQISSIRLDYTSIEVIMKSDLPSNYVYEFAISRDPDTHEDALEWQDSPRFEGLYQGTVYYVFVRAKYAEGEDPHPHGVMEMLERDTFYVNYLEEKIDEISKLRQSGDGAQVDAVIAEAIRRARELTPSPTFYDDLESIYNSAKDDVKFARLQDQKIAALRALLAELLATKSYDAANQTVLQNICDGAIADILLTKKSDEVQSIAAEAEVDMYAVKVTYLRDGDMEVTSKRGVRQSIRLSWVCLSDFASLGSSVESAVDLGNVVVSGNGMRLTEVLKELRTKEMVAAYGLKLLDGNMAFEDFDVNNDGKYDFEFRLLLPESLQNVEGLMVGYYNKGSGELEMLETTRDGNYLVFYSDRVADFVIFGDPVIDLTLAIASLAVVLLCQLIGIILLLVRRRKTSKSTHYAVAAPLMMLTIRMAPDYALTAVAILGALVILFQIWLLYLLLTSDLIRRRKGDRNEPVQEVAPVMAMPVEIPEEMPESEISVAEDAEATAEPVNEDIVFVEAMYADAASEVQSSDEELPTEDTEGVDEIEEDPFAIYDDGEESAEAEEEYAEAEEGDTEESGVEEEIYEDFIEPAANPKYFLEDEFAVFDSDSDAEIIDENAEYEDSVEYDENAEYEEPVEYDENAEYEEPVEYDENAEYEEPVEYDENAEYEEPVEYDENAEYEEPVEYDENAEYADVEEYEEGEAYDEEESEVNEDPNRYQDQ